MTYVLQIKWSYFITLVITTNKGPQDNMYHTSTSSMISYKYWRFTQGFVWRSLAWSMASGGWAWHGGAAEQKVSRRVTLSTGGWLPLPTVNTLIWQGSLEGATGGRRTRKQWLWIGMESDRTQVRQRKRNTANGIWLKESLKKHLSEQLLLSYIK